MEFEWDEAKSESNRLMRGLPLAFASRFFEGFVLEEPDMRRDYREDRIRALGPVDGETLLMVYTDRLNVRRVISLRHANRSECDAYRAAQQQGH